MQFFILEQNRLDGVMVSVSDSSAVDGFDPWLGQTKDNRIGIWCLSTKQATLTSKR